MIDDEDIARHERNLNALTELLEEAKGLFASTFNGAPANVPMGDCVLHFTRRDSAWGLDVTGPDGQRYDGWSISVRCAVADQLEALWAACVEAELNRDLRVRQAVGVVSEFLDKRRKSGST